MTAADGSEATKADFPFPYSGSRTVSNGAVSVVENFDFSAEALAVRAVEFNRTGRGATVSNGELIFSVDTLQTFAISGAFAFEADRGEEMQLIAALTDLTTGTLLMESRQGDNSSSGSYVLGGLVGNRGATFIGSLTNEFVPGHTYRLSYILGLSDFESTAGRSLADGFVTIAAVPEPSSGSIAAMSLALLVITRAGQGRRRARRQGQSWGQRYEMP